MRTDATQAGQNEPLPRIRARRAPSSLALALALTLSVSWPVTAVAAGQPTDRMEALIEADGAASSALWATGFAGLLRQSFEPEAPVLISGAHLQTAGGLLQSQADLPHSSSQGRMSWTALGLRLSSDSSVGVTWGAVMLARDTLIPSMGRYVAVWGQGPAGWRITAFSLLGVAPPATKAWAAFARASAGLDAGSDVERFMRADREFARLAADSGAGRAFRAWAAPDATLIGRRGFLIQGAETIGAAVEGPATWSWAPVAGGGTEKGNIGWTVGEATISTLGDGPFKTKYLSVWQVGPDGSVRFIIDAGNPRP